MASYNRVVVCGNITRDPELRYTPSAMAVCDIGLAINEKYKNASGEWVESPVFLDVTLWGRTAEVASEYLKKGAPVLIEGRLKLDQWEDRESGQKRSKLKVVGEKMQMLGGGKGSSGGGGRQQGSRQQQSGGDDYGYGTGGDVDPGPADDDIQF